MKQVGGVEVPQEAFLAVLNLDDGIDRVSRARRHLYVHLPFCAHRAATATSSPSIGRDERARAYVDALIAELELERGLLAAEVDTVFLGGGTPTFTEPAALARLLAGLPAPAEMTVEANPETVTPGLAALLREHGVNRVSLGAQSFQPHLLDDAGAARAARTTSGAPCTRCGTPASTTSRSTSSTGFRARASPISSATSPRRSHSSRSTSPATSSRRSPARASRTPTATSSSGRPTRWRTTSSGSSRH